MMMLKLALLLSLFWVSAADLDGYITFDVDFEKSSHLIQEMYLINTYFGANFTPEEFLVDRENLKMRAVSFIFPSAYPWYNGVLEAIGEAICRFTPFRFPSSDVIADQGRAYYFTVNTGASFRNILVDVLNRHGFQENTNATESKVIFARQPAGSAPLPPLSETRVYSWQKWITYKPKLAFVRCYNDKKDGQEICDTLKSHSASC